MNVASRLCGIAKGMQVVVTDATRTAAADRFKFKGPYGVKLKGKNEKERVWLLEEAAERSSS